MRSPLVLVAAVAIGALVAATAIGLAVLWPRDASVEPPPQLAGGETFGAEVVAVEEAECRIPNASGCERVTVELADGPDAGERTSFIVGDQGNDDVALTVGDDLRVFRNQLPEGAVVGGVAVDPYGLADFERRWTLLWLGLGFAALVAVTGRWRGLRALLGLAGSLAVVVFFVVPAILAGGEPVPVALVGAFAVMLLTIPLAHGVGPKSAAAMLGTAASLLVVVALAEAFTGFAHLTGLSSEEAVFLRAATGDVSIRGLLLAGMVIGALGVLDDTTVSQASTVMAIRRANPRLRFRELFRGALAVGHDHIAATVNTLVLAYAGASLPILLVFSLGDTSFGQAVNSEAVAEEIVSMLVGSIGLIAAVPLTTAIAAALALEVDTRRLEDAHGHAH